MSTPSGRHELGPADGLLRVHTYREGLAQKVGHDLILDVTDWRATVGTGEDGSLVSVTLEADPRSLRVAGAKGGAKPLSDSDRTAIHDNIARRVLGADAITFRSRTVEGPREELAVAGELAIAGVTRPASLTVALGPDRRVTGALVIRQSDWGITPYRAFMGALKVRDTVEIVFDVMLPGSPPPVVGS